MSFWHSSMNRLFLNKFKYCVFSVNHEKECKRFNRFQTGKYVGELHKLPGKGERLTLIKKMFYLAYQFTTCHICHVEKGKFKVGKNSKGFPLGLRST